MSLTACLETMEKSKKEKIYSSQEGEAANYALNFFSDGSISQPSYIKKCRGGVFC